MARSATAVLLDRSYDPGGLQRMIVVSTIAHAVLIAILVLVPDAFGVRSGDNVETVMTISLGGAPGPRAGGMTPLGGRPIQEAAPLPEARRPRSVRAPAAPEPAMTLPDPRARRRARPARTGPERGISRTPSEGTQAEPGSAVAETGGRGTGFGLSTGGGGTSGYLDVGNFCCPQYLSTMLDLIRRNWNPRQPVPGQALVKFAIQRDGRLTDVTLEQSSGYIVLDLAAQRAIVSTQQLPPLPAAFPDDRLTIHLNFQYQR